MDSNVGVFSGPLSSLQAKTYTARAGFSSSQHDSDDIRLQNAANFFLSTCLAALKPSDSGNMGHFHDLGSEDSKEDVLFVHIHLKTPSTAHPSLLKGTVMQQV